MKAHPGIVAALALWSCSGPSAVVPVPPAAPVPALVYDDAPAPLRADWLEAVLKEPDREIDLAEAAIVLASHRQGVRRSRSTLFRFLDPMLARVRAKAGSDPDRIIDALNDLLLPELRRAKDGDLAWVHEAFGAEEGSCVPDTLMYLIAGDRMGLGLEPVVIPKHVFVCRRSDSRRRNIECTDRGRSLTVEEYRLSLLEDPTSIDILPQQAEALERAMRPPPRRHFVAMLLGHAARGRPDYVEEQELASRIAPDCEGAPGRIGRFLAQRDEFAKAEPFFSKSIELAPHRPGLYAARASARMLLGKLQGALDDIEAAQKLASDSARFHHIRGLIHFQAERFEAAAEAHSRSILGAPKSAEYRIFRAMAYERLKRYPEAIEDCTQAIALVPNVVKYYERRAKLWAQVGDEAKWEADRKRAAALGGR